MKKNEIRKGFTLAETLIVLVVLGVIAGITIPALVNRQKDSQNRTKIRKAMAAYERVVNQMLIEQGLQSQQAFTDWAKNDATTNSYKAQTNYFKITEKSNLKGYDNCRFKTSDGVWWDICGTNDSNIDNPIIILDNSLLDKSRETLESYAKIEEENGKELFVYGFVGHRDATTGSVRVNDKAYEDSQENNAAYQQEIEKLYAFIDKRAMANVQGGGAGGNDSGQSNACAYCDLTIKDKIAYFKRNIGADLSECETNVNPTNCKVSEYGYIYDNEGNKFMYNFSTGTLYGFGTAGGRFDSAWEQRIGNGKCKATLYATGETVEYDCE